MMEERLKEILAKERLTPARFAELVGVQRSSVSHIISGRNKPSLDFLQKILSTFGHISPDWLISGTGAYKRSDTALNRPEKSQSDRQMPGATGKIAFPLNRSSAKDEQPAEYGRKNSSENHHESASAAKSEKNSLEATGPTPETPMEELSSTPLNEKKSEKKKIIKTLLFYDDHTFEVFYPG